MKPWVATAVATSALILLLGLPLLTAACSLDTVGLDNGGDSSGGGGSGGGSKDSGKSKDAALTEDGRAVVENDSATSGMEAGVADARMSRDAVPDVMGMVPPVCKGCLEANCASAYATCFGDPACYEIVACSDRCVKGGGAPEACGIFCVETSTSDAGQGQAESLVGCAQVSCHLPCLAVGGL